MLTRLLCPDCKGHDGMALVDVDKFTATYKCHICGFTAVVENFQETSAQVRIEACTSCRFRRKGNPDPLHAADREGGLFCLRYPTVTRCSGWCGEYQWGAGRVVNPETREVTIE